MTRSLLNGHLAFVTVIYYSLLPVRMLTMGLQDRQIPVFRSFDYIQTTHQNSLIKEDSTFIYFSIGGDGTIAQRYILDPIEEMPENSWLITLNPDEPLQKDFHIRLSFQAMNYLGNRLLISNRVSWPL